MILSCPACSTRYLVDPAQIGELGRQVKCARCAHEWHQQPPPEAPPPLESLDAAGEAEVSDPAPTPSMPDDGVDDLAGELPDDGGEDRLDGGPDDASPLDDLQPPFSEPPNEERGRAFRDMLDEEDVPRRRHHTNLPALPRKRLRWGLILGWVALILFVLTVLLGGFFARDAIVAAWPPATRLYQVLGLPLAGDAPAGEPVAATTLPAPEPEKVDINTVLKTVFTRREYDTSNGVQVLIVEGYVENISQATHAVPALRLDILDAGKQSLFHWRVTPSAAELAPGGRAPFTTRLPDPPAGASELSASFEIAKP